VPQQTRKMSELSPLLHSYQLYFLRNFAYKRYPALATSEAPVRSQA